jgi:hypothetical protein
MNANEIIWGVLVGLAVAVVFIGLDRQMSDWYLRHRERYGDEGWLVAWFRRRRQRKRR